MNGPVAGAPAPVANTSNVAVDEPARNGATGDESLHITSDNGLISLFAVGVDAHLVFVRLAREAGLRVIVDDSIRRQITVNFVRRAPADVLAAIVAAYGLSSREVNGITVISEGIPTNPSSYLLSDIDAISTQYVLAPTAKSLLPVFLQDHVKTNTEQNAVILSAPPDVLKKFREDIAQFDIPAAQIMIDVLMVEFTDSGAEEFSLRWNWTTGGRSIGVNGPAGEIAYRALSTLPSAFSADLRALVTSGKARVRANPRIATVSGRNASIFIGKQRYISTPVVISGGSDLYARQTNSIDAGVRLNMTPWTGGEGEIIVDIRPEISVLSAPDARTGLPERSTRRADTTVHVQDGETIIIGGLLQREYMTTRTKIPLLGDLPFIGSLFRSKDERDTQTDMVIFITPHILTQTGHLPEAQESILRQRFLDDDAKTPPRL